MKRLLYVIIFLLINQITYSQMRTFNDREKQIIEILCRIDYGNIDFLSYHLQNEYFIKDYNQALFVLTKNKTALLYLKKEVFDDLNLRKKELYLFMEFISLIDYLKSERYITVFPNNHVYESELHIMKQSFKPKIDNKNNTVILNDKGLHISPKEAQNLLDKDGKIIYTAVKLEQDIYDWTIENLMGLVLVSEELKDLKSHNYIAKEDRKFKKSQTVAWISISLAVLFGLISLFYTTRKKETDVILNQTQFQTLSEQYDKFIETENNIKSEIQNLKLDRNINDTINE